jgi:predicted peptidase
LHLLVETIVSHPSADPERLYLIGLSMGGYATWQLAMSMPEYFAAVVPICGGGMYWDAYRLRDVPIWAFHGDADGVVYVEESKKMVNAVNQAGGNAKLTIYPGVEHNSWTDTYANYEVFEWMLSHRNAHVPVQENKYNDRKKFG